MRTCGTTTRRSWRSATMTSSGSSTTAAHPHSRSPRCGSTPTKDSVAAPTQGSMSRAQTSWCFSTMTSRLLTWTGYRNSFVMSCRARWSVRGCAGTRTRSWTERSCRTSMAGALPVIAMRSSRSADGTQPWTNQAISATTFCVSRPAPMVCGYWRFRSGCTTNTTRPYSTMSATRRKRPQPTTNAIYSVPVN